MRNRTGPPARTQDWVEQTRRSRERAASDLARGVAAARTAAGWPALLAFAAREGVLPLHLHNVLLLQQQHPSASRVLPAPDWLRLGRVPQRGAVPLRLWQPRDPRRADPAREADAAFAPPGEHPSAGPGGPAFRLASLYDISQTAGPDVPQLPPPDPRAAAADAWDEIGAAVAAAGFEICFESVRGGRSGYVAWDDRVVVLDGDDGDGPAACTALAEQWAVLLMGRPAAGGTVPDAAFAAASAARLAAARFGLPARGLALPEGWETADTARIRACGTAALSLGRQVVHRLAAAGTGLDRAPAPAPPPPVVAAVAL